MSEQPINPWRVEADQSYSGKPFWSIYKHHPKAYGGQQFLLNAKRTDKRRFYSEEKARKVADSMNQADAAA